MFFNRILRATKRFSRRDDFCGFLFELLGCKPRNKHIYSLAFVHRSVSVFHKGEKLNNERLEYLGDAILGAVVADILYKNFPKQKEGFLTKLRSKIVSRDQLNYIGKELGFPNHIQSKGVLTDNIIGNSVEAFVGAVYLDFGYKKAKMFVQRKMINKFIDFEEIMKQNVNFKSKLLEWGQCCKKEVKFDTVRDEDKEVFKTKVIVDNVVMGKGVGGSKKNSHQVAAQKALEKLEKEK